ncbi:MAG: GTPase, partial [Nanobdellota archaeon]
KVQHKDFFGVKRQGHRQFMLVGLPSAGKSSLVNKLAGAKAKVGSYAFTTLQPQPAILKVNGADIQIVDLPGLVKGAADDIGGGKRLLGLVRNSDGIILLHDLTQPYSKTQVLLNELKDAAIDKPMIIVGSKGDLPASKKGFVELKRTFPDNDVLAVSVETGDGLEELKSIIWKKSNLIRVYLKDESEPMVLDSGSTVEDVVRAIHNELLEKFKSARVSGQSAKFDNQQVGLDHELSDCDRLEFELKS